MWSKIVKIHLKTQSEEKWSKCQNKVKILKTRKYVYRTTIAYLHDINGRYCS